MFIRGPNGFTAVPTVVPIDVAGNGNSISNLQVGTGLSYQLQVVGKSVPVSVQQYGRK